MLMESWLLVGRREKWRRRKEGSSWPARKSLGESIRSSGHDEHVELRRTH
jgi:hypothetical protein